MASEHEHHELTDFQNGAIVEGCKFSMQAKVACHGRVDGSCVGKRSIQYSKVQFSDNDKILPEVHSASGDC